jgi:hypothetical protein
MTDMTKYRPEKELVDAIRDVTDVALKLASGDDEIITKHGEGESAIQAAMHNLDVALFDWSKWLECEGVFFEADDMRSSLLHRLEVNRDHARERRQCRVYAREMADKSAAAMRA